MCITREGWRELLVGTVVLGGLVLLSGLWFPPLAIPFVIVWAWLVSFFRDPKRVREYAPNDLCAPADGTVTEIAELEKYEPITGRAVRIGIFLSLFDVHANRSPCGGRIRSLEYRPGRFLDARHPDSGRRNESNTIVLDPADPMPGPVVVRQIVGLIARRIVCHGLVGDEWTAGQRFGMLKFGSRTELIIPRRADTEICVSLGDKVRAGMTIVARQPVASPVDPPHPAAGPRCDEEGNAGSPDPRELLTESGE